ncbi:winged helix-turn-helix domain-containing protein [Haloarchaeobius sp. DFWS5]|uniref:winged helix-turn-helix domain-containing protein n=1 Tax=Haloarchaeobius sp. DFWS5 TaxID=3446114 RepID=UPI003EBD6C54
MSDVVVERLPPDEAFELLAHETRFRILEVLLEADGRLPFSELRERTGVRDPGQFNYHLGKLTGRFVVKGGKDGDDEDGDEENEGYRLSGAGMQIVGGVLSGGYTKEMDAEPVDTGEPCIGCGESMELQFRPGAVRLTCPACDVDFTDMDVPPGILEGVDPADAPAVLDRWLKRLMAVTDHGFCFSCDGQVDKYVFTVDGDDAPSWVDPDEDEGEAGVRYDCQRCERNWHSDAGIAVLSHPAVVSFLYEHGVDVRETPLWAHSWLSIHNASVVQREPLRVDVTIELEEERLVLTLDRSVDLVETRRESA